MNMKPIKREKIHFRVAKEIEHYIARNGLKQGDVLPSEKKIAQDLGIGRSSVREGIRLLEGIGLVRVLPGKGIYVDNTSDTSIPLRLSVSRKSLLEALEVRQALEIQAYTLAHARASQQDWQDIDRAYAALREKCVAKAAIGTEDMDFHLALYRAGHNDFLENMLEGILGVFLKAWQNPMGIGHAFHETFALHEALYECIRKGDESGIVQTVRQIIAYNREKVCEQYAQDEPT